MSSICELEHDTRIHKLRAASDLPHDVQYKQMYIQTSVPFVQQLCYY